MYGISLTIHTRHYFDSLRHFVRKEVDAKLGHIDEAIARAAGFNTRAALLVALDSPGGVAVRWNGDAFAARLAELSGTEPDWHALERAIENMILESAQAELAAEGSPDPEEDSAETHPSGEDDDWFPPWKRDEDDPLRMAWEHDMSSRGNR